MSASNKPTLQLVFFNAIARFVAKVDLPTPPLALEIAIVNLVPLIGFFESVFVLNFLSLCQLDLIFIYFSKYHYLVFVKKDII